MLVPCLMYLHISCVLYYNYFLVFLVLFATYIDLTTSLNVRFHQSSYNINEGDQLLQPQLILNDSSLTNITVLIKSINITATGEYINIIINNMFIIIILQEEVLIIILDHAMSHFLQERPMCHLMSLSLMIMC